MNVTVMNTTICYDVQIVSAVIPLIVMVFLCLTTATGPIAIYSGSAWQFSGLYRQIDGAACGSLLAVFGYNRPSMVWIPPPLLIVFAYFGLYFWPRAAFFVGLSFFQDYLLILAAAALAFACSNSLAQNTNATHAKFFAFIFYELRQWFFDKADRAFFHNRIPLRRYCLNVVTRISNAKGVQNYDTTGAMFKQLTYSCDPVIIAQVA
jgi:hypothetical protein